MSPISQTYIVYEEVPEPVHLDRKEKYGDKTGVYKDVDTTVDQPESG